MDKVLHLHIQKQWFISVLDIESVKAAAFSDDRHIRLVTEILHHRLHTDDILRTVSLACHEIRGTEIHITYSRREDDVGRLVVGHFQPIRRYHPVKGEFPGQTMIEVAVFLLRIDILGQCHIVFFCRYGIGLILCESTRCAQCKGKHYKNLFHTS